MKDHLFTHKEGMTYEDSTIQERQEIVKLLIDKGFWWNKPSVKHLDETSVYCGFYRMKDGCFVHSYMPPHDIINIPYEEFKKRLNQ